MFPYNAICPFCQSSSVASSDHDINIIICGDCSAKRVYQHKKEEISSYHKSIGKYRVHWLVIEKETIITSHDNITEVFRFNYLLPLDINLNKLKTLINLYSILQ